MQADIGRVESYKGVLRMEVKRMRQAIVGGALLLAASAVAACTQAAADPPTVTVYKTPT
jgi:hypothetical protein